MRLLTHYGILTRLTCNQPGEACVVRYDIQRRISNIRTTAVIDDEVKRMLDEGMKPKDHPGRRAIPCVTLPPALEQACHRVIQKHKRPSFNSDVINLHRQFHHRLLPPEPEEIRLKLKEIEFRVGETSKRKNDDETYLTDEERAAALSEKVQKILKRETYNWKPIEYDGYKSVVYMTARMVANFAALKSVFHEIKKDDPSFAPKSLFDFGSGVGTTLWAAMEIWPKEICEYFAVDISPEAADIADLLLRRGDENNRPIFKNTLTRQFLPVSSHTKYDLVVCAYSLMDLPSRSARVDVIENLWHKTNDILVVIEHGKKGGFSAVMEARDLILQSTGHKVTETFKVDSSQRGVVSGDAESIPCSHTMAPCPHNFPCPKLFTGQVNPCTFSVSFNHLILPELRKHLWGTQEIFSYVIMRKKPLALKDTPPWPRIITKPKRKHEAVRCDLCCPNGTLQNVLFTKRYHERSLHKIAKYSKWSDLLPATVIEYFKSRDGRIYLEPGYESDPNYAKAVEKLMLLEGGKTKDSRMMIGDEEKNEKSQSEQLDSESSESDSDSDDDSDGSSSDSNSSCEDDETHPPDSFNSTKRRWTIKKS